jgi:hypothetical protein
MLSEKQNEIRPTLTSRRWPSLCEPRSSEASRLLHLDAKQLESILAKRRLKLGGSKRDRIARLLADVATSTP